MSRSPDSMTCGRLPVILLHAKKRFCNREYDEMMRTFSTRGISLLIGILTIFAGNFATAQPSKLEHAAPEQVGMRSEQLALIEELVRSGLEEKRMPGCVVTVGRGGKIVYQRAFGFKQLEPESVPMTTDTVFDMASITKPVATATSTMILMEQGKIRLRDKISTYIPEFANSGKEQATVMHLLTHQAGFVPDNALADYKLGREQAFKNIYDLKAMYPPSTRFVYSDVGFILLDDLIERQSGMKVNEFAEKHIFCSS